MSPVHYTLLADGPTDHCLRRVINWVLDTIPEVSQQGFVDQIADLRGLRQPPRGLSGRMSQAVELFPCDILFVHRDAERSPLANRVDEIRRAAEQAQISRHIAVVPVRMTEAWLLIDEQAIRRAAGNPNGAIVLRLPNLQELEQIADPKHVLRDLLLNASEMSGRRREKLKRQMAWRAQRVADLIDNFAPLRELSAFRAFESETTNALRARAPGD